MIFTVAFAAFVGVFPPTRLVAIVGVTPTSNLNSPADGFGYKLTSNELVVVVVTGTLIFVPAAQPACVSDCVLAVPCVPQEVCPFTDKLPPIYPVLNCKVMVELSALALVMVVLLGLVQRKTLAAT